MTRAWNFSAGPAVLPQPVLEQAAAEMLDWHGSGMSVMEMSHRGPEFGEILHQAQADLRELLAVPPQFHILFMQGGGLGENAIVPLNLAQRLSARRMDFVVTGSWSAKSMKEASRFGDAALAATNDPAKTGQHTAIPVPSSWRLRDTLSYVHLCSNETIHGVEFQELPDLKALGSDAPLVVDLSSHILSRPVDWSRVGLAFAGAQKNVGPAGVTLVFVREDLLGHSLSFCPSAFEYRNVADNDSMFNTPPTYGIYVAGLVFQWLKREGGVAEMERRALLKSQLLYDYIDASGLYENRVDAACRSRMNVPFFLHDDRLNAPFLEGARERRLLQLKGHKSVGGMRASLYNAMPLEGVQELVSYMREFAARHG